jgi:hypothetical protein
MKLQLSLMMLLELSLQKNTMQPLSLQTTLQSSKMM